MTNYFIVPGLGNSAPEHWQSYFEKSGGNFQRILQRDWESPVCTDWIETIDKAISTADLATVVLVGHSLGCMAIVHWTKRYGKKIKGALMVAPSDPEASHYTFPATGFAPVPNEIINFNTIVVASTDDVWVSIDRARYFARSWHSEFINLGEAGHINVASGYGEWKDGLEILKRIG